MNKIMRSSTLSLKMVMKPLSRRKSKNTTKTQKMNEVVLLCNLLGKSLLRLKTVTKVLQDTYMTLVYEQEASFALEDEITRLNELA
jgi:hypothetical protein